MSRMLPLLFTALAGEKALENFSPSMSAAEALVHSLSADLGERHVAAGCSDGVVRLYSVADGKLASLVDLPGHAAPVTKAVFVGQGDVIVSADFSGWLMLWKLENGVFANKVNKQLLSGPIYDVAARDVGGDITVFCGCDGGHLKTLVFDRSFSVAEESQEVHRYGVSAVDCNDVAVVTSGFEFVVALHTDGGVERFRHHKAAVNAVAVAPHNHMNKLVFASCSDDGTLVVSERRDGKFVHQTIEIGEPCLSLAWNNSGLVLTLGYGDDKFKSFILGLSGQYEEVAMKDVSN
ncbi:protein transport protein SEC13 [Pancytospora philotis]|nr:protein transport protein SEC13 [Pancytospora philotis]